MINSESKVLIVEDEPSLAATLGDYLTIRGHNAAIAGSLKHAEHHLNTHAVDLLLLDLTLPDGSGLRLLERVQEKPRPPKVIVLTADSSASSLVSEVSDGTADYLVKPVSLKLLETKVSRSISPQPSQQTPRPKDLIAAITDLGVVYPTSKAMQRVLEQVVQCAQHEDLPVVVLGETGVGKEHICHLLHRLSARRHGPFLAVNCAEFDKQLLRSELFGHERGAFTGAAQRRNGLLEMAENGTLFLDEVAELSLETQAMLLRAFEQRTFRRLGGTRELRTNARFVMATNRCLRKAVSSAQFREDLFYRINAIEIQVPPLRERPEDIAPLAEHVLGNLAASFSLRCKLSANAGVALQQHSWPGNVRELRHVLQRCVLEATDPVITASSLAKHLPPQRSMHEEPHFASNKTLSLEELEWRHISETLQQWDGNRTRAARALGISRSTLIRRLTQLQGKA